jgi:uncharacterized metal-binding protein YceD (DUF177 family)
MCNLESFKIDLKGMKTDEQRLEFDLNDDFFKALDVSEVNGGALHVSVSIRKATGFYELQFHAEGTVTVPCDICLDDMDQPIETDHVLVAKLGAETNTEDDDVVTVDENEGILDTSWLIYEFIVLAIPIRHVHAPGKCNTAMLKALEEHSSDRSSDEESTDDVDPRWEKLKGLKI